MKQEKIVVLGAGFGGLRAAIFLARRGRPVTLVDRNEYHTYVPLLYEIAVTDKELANYCDLKSIVTIPVKDLIAGLPIDFMKDEVREVDVINRVLRGTAQEIHFDTLILALGAETNFFDIPGLKEYALTFKSFADAVHLRELLSNLPFGAKPRVVIGGGGATGVELAGEIQMTGLANVTIIQSPPDILPGFNERVVAAANKRLKEIGTTIVLDRIAQATDKNVILKESGELSYDIFIWTGGTKPNRAVHALPLKKERQGRIEVQEGMACLPSSPEMLLAGKVYAIGDLVCFYDEQGKLVPGLASIAIDQAKVAARNILGKKTTYQPKKFPYILPIGGKYAIFSYGNIVIEGLFAWVLKGLVELKYLFSIMRPLPALRIWFKGLKIFMENDRLG